MFRGVMLYGCHCLRLTIAVSWGLAKKNRREQYRPAGDEESRPMKKLGDPVACRERAAYCAKRAATASSPVAREKFANMAQVWLHLAVQLEEQCALRDQWNVKPAVSEADE